MGVNFQEMRDTIRFVAIVAALTVMLVTIIIVFATIAILG